MIRNRKRKTKKIKPPAPAKSEAFSGKLLLFRPKNEELRNREHLTPEEMGRVIEAAKLSGRHRLRDGTLVLLAYRHGLRVSEAIALRWIDIDLKGATIYIRRLKGGLSGTHPLSEEEVNALTALKNNSQSPWIFESERGGPLGPDTARKIFARAGEIAEIGFPIHFHMARHSCGYALANKSADLLLIQSWMGHRDISNTVRYTALAPNRFNGLWD